MEAAGSVLEQCNTTDRLISPVCCEPLRVNSSQKQKNGEENSSLSSAASSVTRGSGVVHEMKVEEESEDEEEMGRRSVRLRLR